MPPSDLVPDEKKSDQYKYISLSVGKTCIILKPKKSFYLTPISVDPIVMESDFFQPEMVKCPL